MLDVLALEVVAATAASTSPVAAATAASAASVATAAAASTSYLPLLWLLVVAAVSTSSRYWAPIIKTLGLPGDVFGLFFHFPLTVGFSE